MQKSYYKDIVFYCEHGDKHELLITKGMGKAIPSIYTAFCKYKDQSTIFISTNV